MKRSIWAFALLFLMCFSGCSSPKIENFENKQALLTEIKDFAIAYAEANPDRVDANGRLTLNFIADQGITYWDGKQHLTVDASETAIAQVTELRDMGFTYLWVDGDAVIFWDDELHGYGILWSETPRRTIREMRMNWYDRMDSRKLASQWYEIGQLYII